MPTPDSRLCSAHFDNGATYRDHHGRVQLTDTAVPTLFLCSESFHWNRETEAGPRQCRDVWTDHTYSLSVVDPGDFQVAAFDNVDNVVEILGGEVGEEDTAAPAVAAVARELRSVRDSGGATLARAYHNSEHSYFLTQSPRTLKRTLFVARDELATYRKRLKMQRQTIGRLKRTLTCLSSVMKELKAKGMITTDCVRILLGLLQLPKPLINPYESDLEEGNNDDFNEEEEEEDEEEEAKDGSMVLEAESLGNRKETPEQLKKTWP